MINGGSGGGGGHILLPLASFSVPYAISYLGSVQSSDGSFGGSDLYTDWAAIALAAATTSGSVQTNLLNYISSHTTISPLLTDTERHCIALLALGQNPYSYNGTDYVTPIVQSFDGTQFGDTGLDNDDIFALIPLARVGYTVNDTIIAKDIAFIISKQNSDGSWDESVDMTAAAIEALQPFGSSNGIPDAITKASRYLQSMQASDGGFGSIYSTSWVAQAMNMLSVSWVKNGHTVSDYFASQQASDGAALTASETAQNRIWATSYVIPAVLGKPWSMIMHAVSKPVSSSPTTSSGNGGGGAALLQSTAPTTSTVVPKEVVAAGVPVTAPVVETPTQVIVVDQPHIYIPIPKPTPLVPVRVVAKIPQKISPRSVVNEKSVATVSPQTRTAMTAESGAQIPLPVFALSLVAISSVLFFVRHFFVKR